VKERHALLAGGLVVGLLFVLSTLNARAQGGAQPKATLLLASQERATQRDRPKRLKEEIDASFVAIPPGSFEIGCSDGDHDCYTDEKPRHTVRITKPFQMMKTDVTAAWFRDWATLNGYEQPQQPDWSADNIPVVNVTWNDARAFCSAFGARLPTEAEWEYAARAWSNAARYGPLDDVAWYDANSGRQARPVAGKKPNTFGLYDMLGNVWEWCADWYGPKYYEEKVEGDPQGPSSGEHHVLRGGSWSDNADGVRASDRGRYAPTGRYVNVGFRCTRDANSPVTVSFSPDIRRAPGERAAQP